MCDAWHRHDHQAAGTLGAVQTERNQRNAQIGMYEKERCVDRCECGCGCGCGCVGVWVCVCVGVRVCTQPLLLLLRLVSVHPAAGYMQANESNAKPGIKGITERPEGTEMTN